MPPGVSGCQRLLSLSNVAHADSLDEQRNRYAQIKQAWDNKQMDVVTQLMPRCKTIRCTLICSTGR
jgi:hypothetical protein